MHFLQCLREDWGELQNGMCAEGGRKHLKKSFLRNLHRDITVRTQDGAEKKFKVSKHKSNLHHRGSP